VSRREEALEQAKEQLREAEDRDRHIVNAVKFLDQLQENEKKRIESFRNWYSLHFPEFESEIGDDEEFVELLERGIHRDELEAFEELAESSTGTELGEKEEIILEKVRDLILDENDLREEIREYISEACMEEMPNLSELLGPVLTAKMLAHAGDLETLAQKPSSTLQMYGAEKALFRYLHGEGTPPKHGVIFEHPLVNQLPEDSRGTMARFLANKASIAARMDQYGDKEKGGELREEAQQKFEELNEN
jgi:nucleolar protein 56